MSESKKMSKKASGKKAHKLSDKEMADAAYKKEFAACAHKAKEMGDRMLEGQYRAQMAKGKEMQESAYCKALEAEIKKRKK